MQEVMSNNSVNNTNPATNCVMSDLECLSSQHLDSFIAFGQRLPQKDNTHTHHTTQVSTIYTGTIENQSDLRLLLESNGYLFETDNDSECLVQLITFFIDSGLPPEEALTFALDALEGDVSLMAFFQEEDNVLYVAKPSSPKGKTYFQETDTAQNTYTIKVIDRHELAIINEFSHSHSQAWSN